VTENSSQGGGSPKYASRYSLQVAKLERTVSRFAALLMQAMQEVEGNTD
jgi:hypothetical protein